MMTNTARIPWTTYAQLVRLPNQSGTLLLMLPTLWALVVASRGRPPAALVAIFVAGSFLMRSAGVILNDLADRDFDRRVARTRDRPLASGRLRPREAMLVAAILIAVSGGLVLMLHPLALALSPVALLLAILYPFSKRVLPIPQVMLGLAFGWGVVMAWAAVRGAVELEAWLLYATTACWAVGYDTIYAIQDREDDTRIGVYSSALLFGTKTWIAVAVALAAMLALLETVGQLAGAGTFFYIALAGVALFFAWQIRELRSGVTPERAFGLFKQHILAGVIILIGFWLGLL
jgi:4-hydroxybenzoate polyprenyltransferase